MRKPEVSEVTVEQRITAVYWVFLPHRDAWNKDKVKTSRRAGHAVLALYFVEQITITRRSCQYNPGRLYFPWHSSSTQVKLGGHVSPGYCSNPPRWEHERMTLLPKGVRATYWATEVLPWPPKRRSWLYTRTVTSVAKKQLPMKSWRCQKAEFCWTY